MKKFLFFFVLLSGVFQSQAQNLTSEAAMNLVQKNKELIGLNDTDIKNSVVSNAYVNTYAGTEMVYLQQSHLGIPVYNSIQSLAFKNGVLVSAQGTRIKNLEARAGNNGTPSIPSEQALQTALRVKDRSIANIAKPTVDGNKLNFGKLGIAFEEITAELMWMPVKESGTIELVWQFFYVPLKSSDYWYLRINAFSNTFVNETNLTIYCKAGHTHTPEETQVTCNAAPMTPTATAAPDQVNLVNNATYHIIPFPAESRIHPGGTPTTVSNPWNLVPGNATTAGWHNDGSFDYYETRGNNVYAQEDRDDNNSTFGLSAQSTTSPDPLTFEFIPNFSAPATQTSPAPNQQFGITNLFYWNNMLHDVSYLYGFDEVSGNFQRSNFSRGGQGNDYVIADAQDAGGSNNANFATPPDGTRPRMQMYMWGGGANQRDGSLDNGVVTHEFAHGISNRLTGGPNVATCLTNAEQMGEGWSDFFTLIYTQDWATANLNTGFTSPRSIGAWASGHNVNGQGMRTKKYSTNFTVNNLVYSTFISAQQHDRGELWAATLWDMTWNIINQVGVINPDILNSTAPGGNNIALRLVMEGMKLQQCNPGFISGRDGILAADQILYNGAYKCAIWEAFRRRGMGVNAREGSTDEVNDQVADFTPPIFLTLTQGGITEVEEDELINYVNTVSVCSDVTNYIIRDTLPFNVTYVSGGTYDAATRVVSFTVTQTAGSTQTYPFTVRVNSGSYHPTTVLFNETVPTAALAPNWTLSSISAHNWTTSNVISLSSPLSIYGRNNNVATDMSIQKATDVALPANSTPRFGFYHRFNTERGWDGGVVEASVNNGAWFDLGTLMVDGKYNSFLNNEPTNALRNRSAFTGQVNTFFETKVNLAQFAGQNFKFRFRFGSDESVAPAGSPGWYIDDIYVINEPWANMRSTLFSPINLVLAVADTSALIIETTVCNDVAITTQPSSTSACGGSDATFTVAASGTAPTYQWQLSTDGGTTWNNVAGAVTSTLTVTNANGSQNNHRYRVIVSNSCPSTVTSTSATLTVSTPAAITTQPSNTTVCSGSNTSFTVTASGSANTYQWQESIDGGTTWTNVTGATTTTLNITGALANMDGNRYRVVVNSCAAPVNSNAAILSVNESATITAQPGNANACSGTDATFSVTAAGSNVSYQWQSSTDGGTTWVNVGGATAATLTVTNVTGAMNNNRYRVLVSNTCTTNLTSSSATLTVSVAAAITTQPVNATVCSGLNTSFTVTASGSANTYQWQVSTDGGTTWTDISGATNTTLSLTAVTAGMNTNRYRVVVGSCSAPVNSNAATLSVNESATITTQPSNANACSGSDATFSVTAAGSNVSYQWQISTDNGATWVNVSGATAATLTVANVTGAMNNDLYRVMVSNACTSNLTSSSATLIVSVAAAITTQPVNATVCSGLNTSFTVTASGSANTYQWQVSTDGGTTWTDVAGATNTTLSLTAVTAGMNNNQYRVIVGSCAGPLTSDAATLIVNEGVTITTQPTAQSACVGNDVTFTIAVTGTTPTLQWQVSTDGGTTWSDISGATSSTLTVTNVASTDNGNQYRAVLSNTCTPNLTSNVATLTITATASITDQPTNQTGCVGGTATYSVTATGSSLGYQWQVSTDDGATWTDISGATSSTLTVSSLTADMDDNQYRANITSCSPGTLVSTVATLTVNEAGAFTTQPANATVCPGNDATFTAATTGVGITYQWQVSTDGGTTWTNVAGQTNATLNLTAVTVAMDDNHYRVVINGVCTNDLASNAAELNVSDEPTITTQPVASPRICEGGDFTLTVAADDAVSFQWQVSTDGGATWTNIAGATNTSHALTNVAATSNANQYRVLVDGACVTVTSNVATIQVIAPPTIIVTGPTAAVCSGSSITLTATGADTYTWTNGVTNGVAFNINTTTTFTVTGTSTDNCTATEDITVTVTALPVVTITASSTQLEPGATATLTAVSNPAATVFTWYKNNVVVAGQTGSTLDVTADEAGDYTASAVVNDCEGTSNSITIQMVEPNFSFITPNPNNGLFQVRVRNTNTNAKRMILIYDAKGARVLVKHFTATPGLTIEVMDINMGNAASGNYMLVLYENDRFVKSAQVHVNK